MTGWIVGNGVLEQFVTKKHFLNQTDFASNLIIGMIIWLEMYLFIALKLDNWV